MLTENLYTSIISKHFRQTEIHSLCALIDQRMTFSLPNYKLREEVFLKIQKINKEASNPQKKQKEAERKIMRDLVSYPFEKEEMYKITVMLKSGEQCMLDLNHDQISWINPVLKNERSTPMQYGTHWVRNQFERTFSGQIEDTKNRPPIITRESVQKTDNFAVLALLFIVSEKEARLLSEKNCPQCNHRPVQPTHTNFVVIQDASAGSGNVSPEKRVTQYKCTSCDSQFYI
ncbi:hypothetical protein [Paenibacillus sp. FSL L8-0463]|uniref:hypothetical protein n=1 Tax=Paenibacillus sp. FSL L8-0463 TaxID=2954687 RepID=UPI00311A8AC1